MKDIDFDKDDYDRFGPEIAGGEGFFNPMLRVNWSLSNVCTYSCSYCAKECHDGSSGWPEIEKVTDLIELLNTTYKSAPYNKEKIVFELLGGELTIWPNLETVLEKIEQTGNLIMLVTNGVRTLDWWKKNAHLFGYVTLSFHPEHADYRHVTEVSNILVDAGCGVGILTLMYPPKWDYCVEAHDFFEANSKAHHISMQRLTLIKTSKEGQERNFSEAENSEWPYTDDQLELMRSRGSINRDDSQIRDRKWLLTNLSFSSSKDPGDQRFISPADVNSHGLNNWKGWDCYIGIDTLAIDHHGHIHKGSMCRNEEYITHWEGKHYNKKVSWPSGPVKCPFEKCFCTHDYIARKIKTQK